MTRPEEHTTSYYAATVNDATTQLTAGVNQSGEDFKKLMDSTKDNNVALKPETKQAMEKATAGFDTSKKAAGEVQTGQDAIIKSVRDQVKPLDSQANEAAWAANRRAEFKAVR